MSRFLFRVKCYEAFNFIMDFVLILLVRNLLFNEILMQLLRHL